MKKIVTKLQESNKTRSIICPNCNRIFYADIKKINNNNFTLICDNCKAKNNI